MKPPLMEKQFMQLIFVIVIDKSKEIRYMKPPYYLDFALETNISFRLMIKFDLEPSIKSAPPFELMSSDVHEDFIVALLIVNVDFSTVII